MSKKKPVVEFERLAFESAVREHPGCVASAKAYEDWMMEGGYTPIGAKRIVTRVQREAVERRQLDKLWKWINESNANSRRARHVVLLRCNTTFTTQPEIKFVPGSLYPTWSRDGGCFRDRNGYEWEQQPTIVEANADIRWVPTVEIVTVGASWVIGRLFPPTKGPSPI